MSGPLLGAPPAPARTIHVSEHPLAQHALTVLRNKHTLPHPFRVTSTHLLTLLMLEATRSLPTHEETVETAAGDQPGRTLTKTVVFLSLTRHGLGLSHDMVEFFPDLLVGTVTLEPSKDLQPAKPRLHLVNAPALRDARIILFDPIVANNHALEVAINLLRRSGATDITLLTFLLCPTGPGNLPSTLSSLTVWTAAVDDKPEDKSGLRAGLVDFSARLYG